MSSAEVARARVIAWIIDLFIVLGVVILFGAAGWLGWLVGGAYALWRDGLFDGQSIGKRIMSLKVVAHQEQLRCTFLDSFVRNLLWVIPIIQIVVGFTGLHALMHDPRGRHWGDRLANTQVVKA